MPSIYEEYRDFILNYLLGLIGVDKRSVKETDIERINFKGQDTKEFEYKDGKLFFGCSPYFIISITSDINIDDDDAKILRNIIPSFFNVSKYDRNGSLQINYKSELLKEMSYAYVVQRGICNWIAGDENNTKNVEEILKILDVWASKTYEGKHVSYGIVFDPDGEPNDNFVESERFLNFLADDFSAVLTDSITSVFVVDKECNLIGYETIFDKIDEKDPTMILGLQLVNNLPIRFADVVTKTVNTSKRVGIFLLSNGDIILSKNKKIRFVKRINKWLNFNVNSFKNALRISIGSDYNIDEHDKLIDEIYSSALDVSFSHGGGIIAVDVDTDKIVDGLKDGERNRVVNRCDYILEKDDNKTIDKYLRDKNNDLDKENRLSDGLLESEINKKMLKRNIIMKLVDGKSFIDINRKLRSELISLDGACILDKEGQCCAFGAIIQSDSGSTGGGRGAAAKKLSTNGFAIKISTDGYIELYCKQQKVFVIK